MKTELVNIKNLKEFAKNIYDNLGGRNILLLRGNLGSGKTTFLNQMFDDRKDIYHHDWGWKFQINNQGEILGSANEEYRFNDLIQDIKNSKDILMDGSCFCNHKFFHLYQNGIYFVLLIQKGILIFCNLQYK